METAVNPQKSKWGKDYVSYEKMDMSWIEFTTQNISLRVSLRMVSAGWDDEEEKFFRTQASDVTNGCFLCVMKREVRKKEREKIK